MPIAHTDKVSRGNDHDKYSAGAFRLSERHGKQGQHEPGIKQRLEM